MNQNPHAHDVAPGTMRGTVNALAAAAEELTVKCFVLASTSDTALIPKLNDPVEVTTEIWNDEVIAFAYRDPHYDPERAYSVYAGSNLLAEKEAWKFMCERKPACVLNTVLPNVNYGASLDLANQDHPSKSGIVAELLRGNWAPLAGLPARTSSEITPTLKINKQSFNQPEARSRVLRRRVGMCRITRQSTFGLPFAQALRRDAFSSSPSLLTARGFLLSCTGCTQAASFPLISDLSDIIPCKPTEVMLQDIGGKQVDDSRRER